MSDQAPSPFDRKADLLTVREFELYRESQNKLDGEREARITLLIRSLSDKTDAQFRASDKALELATAEINKHLDGLNGEQARLAADRERFISRDAYDVAQKEFSIWRDQINAALSIGAGRDRGIGLSWGVITGAIGILVSVVSMIIVLIKLKP